MNRATQRDRILALLEAARGQEVSLPEILALRISQFGARIKEARAAGYKIENRIEHINGAVHSWYRLESSPDEVTRTTSRENTRPNTHGEPKEQIAPAETFPQFGNLAEESRYPD
jgi:Helix-turn-helix domain